MSLVTVIFFLSSGLFLGWSLGANDAANVFGTAVASKMVKFRSAAIICSVFVIIGAVVSGAGASHTLGKLGSITALAGAFTLALSAAFTVFLMTKAGLPVSTSQAIVGAIIGWNIFSKSPTDPAALAKIVSTWVICPVLSAVIAFILYWIVRRVVNNSKVHILRFDFFTRYGLIVVGAFGSYSLGANNIANVMGVFVPQSPFQSISVGDLFTISNTQQLFFFGAVAIAVGVYTYSKKVMLTVGNNIFRLSSITSLIVVLASSIVLFVFASKGLQEFLHSMNLPAFPLVPVSSSQAVVGAVLGIGIAKNRKNVNYSVLLRIAFGWVTTPLASGALAFVALFVMQNVFLQTVY